MIDINDLKESVKKIKAVFFDVNGTLRERELHEPTQKAARMRILTILGKTDVPDDFWADLEDRHKAYVTWAQDSLVQASEREIWTRWMLPEESDDFIGENAPDLMLAWSERKGRVVPKPETQHVLAELKRRGYMLGLISNTMSTLDIPGFAHRNGWSQYLDAMVLSSIEKTRKPSSAPFYKAAGGLGLAPQECAYVGNKFSKDIVGCKRADFSLGIMMQIPGKPCQEVSSREVEADLVIVSLDELLDVFPSRVALN